MIEPTKVCNGPLCQGAMKPLSEFSKRKASPSGLQPRCRKCQAAYYQSIKEKHSKWNAQNYQKHLDEHRARHARNHQLNRDEYNARHRRTYWDNREDVLKRMAEKANTPEGREKSAAKNRRRRTILSGSEGHHSAEEFNDLCSSYGYKCLACEKTGIKLEADHVIPIFKGGSNNIDNIQPLCVTCNRSKGTKTIDYRLIDFNNNKIVLEGE